MLTELHRKAGKLCQPAITGQQRCPLLVRSSSEDVITGHLVQSLRVLQPRWWLSDFLNAALGEPRFRRQHYRQLKIQPWFNQPGYPRELLPWKEGSTQVDLVISWENPPTTIFVEAKYQSELSKSTANSGRKFPADQLIRNIRVGLYTNGYFDWQPLIEGKPRDFVTILLAPRKGNAQVAKYRDLSKLVKSIPSSDRLTCLPRSPFVGELDYQNIQHVLSTNRKFFSRAECIIAEQLSEYLDHKFNTMQPTKHESEQTKLFE